MPAITDWRAAWREDAALYRRLIGALVRSQMQYRASFLMMTFVSFAATATELLAIVLLFGRFGELAGWSMGEVALLYGLASVAFGLNEIVAAGFDEFPQTIRRGEFDRVLMRPVSAFVQVLAADFQLRRLGRTSQGVLALALAFATTPIDWTPAKALYLPCVIACGCVMFMALTVLGAVLCFWTVQSIEVINIVTYGGTEMASYPLPIYHAVAPALLHLRRAAGLRLLLPGALPARPDRSARRAGLAPVRDAVRGVGDGGGSLARLAGRRPALPEHRHVDRGQRAVGPATDVAPGACGHEARRRGLRLSDPIRSSATRSVA